MREALMQYGGWAEVPESPTTSTSEAAPPESPAPKPKPTGTVIVKGNVSQIILTKKGRPYSAGKLAPGTYKVEAKFDVKWEAKLEAKWEAK